MEPRVSFNTPYSQASLTLAFILSLNTEYWHWCYRQSCLPIFHTLASGQSDNNLATPDVKKSFLHFAFIFLSFLHFIFAFLFCQDSLDV